MGRGDVMPVAGGNVTCGYGKCSAGLRDPGTDCRAKMCVTDRIRAEIKYPECRYFCGQGTILRTANLDRNSLDSGARLVVTRTGLGKLLV